MKHRRGKCSSIVHPWINRVTIISPIKTKKEEKIPSRLWNKKQRLTVNIDHMETWIVQKADGKQRAACISSAVCLSLAAGVFTQRGSVETSTWKLSRPCGRPTATRGPWKKIIIPPFHSILVSLVNKETFLQIFFPYRTMANPRVSFLSQKISWTTRRT